MFQVKVMRQQDFAFAVKLANTMNWNMEEQDFQFNLALEPEGCFVLFDGEEPVGVASCISFGKVGWFGNLIVKEEIRGRGGAKLLLQHSIDYLHKKGVETIGLYAYQHLKGFYGRFGFKPEEDFSVYNNPNAQVKAVTEPSTLQCRDFSALNKLDTQYFGADRKRLLEAINQQKNSLCHAVLSNGQAEGYVLAKVSQKMAEVGPLICKPDRTSQAHLLLESALHCLQGRFVSLYIQKKQSALCDFLVSVGFKEAFTLSRMFLGTPKVQECIYAAESLERG
jgi:predicted GNAT family N-acyltransferase